MQPGATEFAVARTNPICAGGTNPRTAQHVEACAHAPGACAGSYATEAVPGIAAFARLKCRGMSGGMSGCTRKCKTNPISLSRLLLLEESRLTQRMNATSRRGMCRNVPSRTRDHSVAPPRWIERLPKRALMRSSVPSRRRWRPCSGASKRSSCSPSLVRRVAVTPIKRTGWNSLAAHLSNVSRAWFQMSRVGSVGAGSGGGAGDRLEVAEADLHRHAARRRAGAGAGARRPARPARASRRGRPAGRCRSSPNVSSWPMLLASPSGVTVAVVEAVGEAAVVLAVDAAEALEPLGRELAEVAERVDAHALQPLGGLRADAPELADGSGGRMRSTLSGAMTVSPSGLSRSLASLARNLFGATPTEPVRCVSRLMRSLIAPAIFDRRAEEPQRAGDVEERLVDAERLDERRERRGGSRTPGRDTSR